MTSLIPENMGFVADYFRLGFDSDLVHLWFNQDKTIDNDYGTAQITADTEFDESAGPFEIWLEGVNIGLSDVEIIWHETAEAGHQVYSFDSFQVWVDGGLDVDIDSDNNDGDQLPDRSQQEDLVETNSTGKVIQANIQDRDKNGILDFIEGYNRDGILATEDDILVVDFDQVVIELPGFVDLDAYSAEDIEITISYRANDPQQVYDDAEGNPLLPSATGLVRLWTKEIMRNANVVSA